MKISEILWRAANENLWPGLPFDSYLSQVYSCIAVAHVELGGAALRRMKWAHACRKSRAIQFLRELGCPIGGSRAFDRFSDSNAAQGARYLWLMFAYEVAKSEGL